MAIGSPQWMYASGEAYTVDQSLKFNDDDSPYLTRTPASAGNRKTWTWSVWVKKTQSTTETPIFIVEENGDNRAQFRFNDDQIRIYDYSSSALQYDIKTNAVYRDNSAWFHILFAIDTTQGTASNRAKLYVNGTQVTDLATATYPSQNSEGVVNKAVPHNVGAILTGGTLRYFEGYQAELNFIDGQALTPSDFGETGDYGEWKPKEYSGTYGTNGFYLPFKQDYTVEGFSTVLSTGNATNKYVGGTGFKPSLVWNKTRSANQNHFLYDRIRGAGNELRSNLTNAEGTNDGVLAFKPDGFTRGSSNDCNENGITYVDWCWDMGADTPTGFGCVTWYGNSSAGHSIGDVGFQPDLIVSHRRSGADNGMVFDSVRGENARLLHNLADAEATSTTILEAFEPDGFRVGTDGYMNYASGHHYVAWCWDMGGTTVTNTDGGISSQVRANTTYGQSIVTYTGTGSASSVGHGLDSAPDMVILKCRNASSDWSVYHTGINAGWKINMNDTAGEADDLNNETFGNLPSSITSTTFGVGTHARANASGNTYVAYCFHDVTGYSKFSKYSGSGTSGNTITTGFRPAMVIIKDHEHSGENWYIFDSTREPLGELDTALKWDENVGDTTSSTKKIEFTDTGFKLNSTNNALNGSGHSYIYMAFAGGMDSISDYNTDGSIDSRVKANTTYGQSIVSYTGNGAGSATVGHGLSSAPEMMIVRSRGSNAWAVYHTSMGNTHLMELNTTAAKADNNTFWNDTSPTSSVFTIGSHGEVNANNTGFIAYCWHSVTGYSKFGSFTGNSGSQTITTGFRPAFLLLKRSSNTSGWYILDNTRSPTNPAKKNLSPNTSGVESTASSGITFTDTGFQESGFINDNGETIIYMAFADKREYAYWLDQSGNNNDWTSNNLTESDISLDSPSNNFCTMNPLSPNKTNLTFSEGNLKLAGWDTGFFGTMGVSSGKWYWEMHSTNASGNANNTSAVGIVHSDALHDTVDGSSNSGFEGYGGTNKARGYYGYDGNKLSASSSASYGDAFVTGDIIGVALNLDDGEITFYKNNVSQGVAFTSLGSGEWFPLWQNWTSSVGVMNFGQDSSFSGIKTAQGNQDSNDIGDFYYTPPTGFLALCTSNLPDVAVTPSEHFNTVLYSGDGGTQSITGVGFAPDLIWKKARNETRNHYLADRVRGNTKELSSNTTDAEDTSSTYTTFSTDGWSMGATSAFNKSGINYAAWNWKANGSGSSNTNGSITSTVSANVDAGFSIVSYTGDANQPATVGHGLSKAPEMVIVKRRNVAGGWSVYSGDATDYMMLNLTSATADADNFWNDTHPSSSVFTLGNNAVVNANGGTYIAYCFHSVDGYSKVGSYTGNGNADGTFVYTGFRPAFVMIKPYSDSGEWPMYDNKRNPSNVTDEVVRANSNAAEATQSSNAEIDMYSNGFKPRGVSGWQNTNGRGYIYIAFAETPFKYSNGR